jgi:hypothetical protein
MEDWGWLEEHFGVALLALLLALFVVVVGTLVWLC